MLFECLVYNSCVPILVQPNYRKNTRNKDSESRMVFTTLSGRQQHLTHTGLGHREGMFTLGLYLLLHHWCRGVIDIVNSVSYSSLWAVSLRRAWSCEFPLFRIHSALLLCIHCIQCLKVRLLSANLRKCTQVWLEFMLHQHNHLCYHTVQHVHTLLDSWQDEWRCASLCYIYTARCTPPPGYKRLVVVGHQESWRQLKW